MTNIGDALYQGQSVYINTSIQGIPVGSYTISNLQGLHYVSEACYVEIHDSTVAAWTLYFYQHELYAIDLNAGVIGSGSGTSVVTMAAPDIHNSITVDTSPIRDELSELKDALKEILEERKPKPEPPKEPVKIGDVDLDLLI